VRLVIVTVTDVERDAVRSYLKPIPATCGYARVRTATQTFYLGLFGSYYAAHVECSMGSVGISGAQNTTNDAIAFWRPALVIMPGIAFGKDAKKQALGDVLVASSIIQYEPQRIGSKTTIQRGAELQAGQTILDRLRDARANWRIVDGGIVAHVGPVLSGEKLVDKPAFRASLFKAYPTAIGGEMEGAGLASVCVRHKTEWGLVKGICDWADGKKNKRYQSKAAKAAVRFLATVFDGAEGFRSLGIPTVNAAGSSARLITNIRSTFLNDVSQAAPEIGALLQRVNAPSVFGKDITQSLHHAAAELCRNALKHGRASVVHVSVGTRDIVLRDDGASFDPTSLARRHRTPGKDAGSFIMDKLANEYAQSISLKYDRDDAVGHNILRMTVNECQPVSERERCTLPVPLDITPFEDPAPRLPILDACSKVYLRGDQLLDLSSAWRYVNISLAELKPDQILVVLCGSDRVMRALLREIPHPQLMVEIEDHDPTDAA
jgi:nucleoside phosphorylase/anti-sigma regulatory factor (Ser/Thr protein kinase)